MPFAQRQEWWNRRAEINRPRKEEPGGLVMPTRTVAEMPRREWKRFLWRNSRQEQVGLGKSPMSIWFDESTTLDLIDHTTYAAQAIERLAQIETQKRLNQKRIEEDPRYGEW